MYNTDLPVWFQEWSICHITLVLYSWVHGHLKKDAIVLICWKFFVCIRDCHWLHSAGILHSVQLTILVVILPRFYRIAVCWIWGVSFSHSESSIDGTVYHSMWLTLQASMCSRMVSVLWEDIRWASLWTDCSVWPYGLTCFWGSSGTGADAPGQLPGKLLMNRDLHNANLAAILSVSVRLIENRLIEFFFG